MRPETFHAIVRGDRSGPLAAAARLGLWAASGPYRLGVWWRNRGYDRGRRPVVRAGVPVVSVGNLTLGGTGKTPCVEYVAGFYRDIGLQAAILSRGYGAAAGPNDEALVLEENLPDVPHLQDADRAAAALRAVEELESEVLVLDDGFQHRRLHRDLDVVLIDATLPPHRDRMFPRGTLREPEANLKRAAVVLLTRCDQAPDADATRTRLTTRFPHLTVATSEHRPIELLGGDVPEPVESLRGKVVAGFAGIGSPPAFRRTLESLGATVADFRAYPDHHPYTRADVDDLRAWAARLPPDALVATTQKDWVKLRLPELAGRPLRAVRVGLAVRDGRDAFEAALARVVTGERPE
ncbi:tetraacyldisaccharide 4'-kinase [Urbifossiella limnaea]|uniref:Tetraacyldisaccharide 4'-kinase n=1 Tax=Urbifossiella limnaea TaxID=2528023 RepID=A0A517XY80_9BACT|nr:tetraacyldisaccharide 4'-kinase [Urbifossiella limnaea]QDU22452.1 Tetraacyldisaccharide 4'-kinase [Urbifossiella limnaea]